MTIGETYFRPTTLEEASALLREGNAHPIAGGTDVIVKMRRGIIKDKRLIDIKRIPSLFEIEERDGGIVIGSGVRLSVLASEARIVSKYPALAEGAASIGTPQIRNLGTIGGNVCNSSPCADTAPGLLVSDASVIVYGNGRTKEIGIGDFWKGPGMNVLEPGELISGFFLPRPTPSTRQAFRKLGPRRAADIAVVNLAISFTVKDDSCSNVRITVGSAAPTPIRATTAEKLMENKPMEALDFLAIASTVVGDTTPISDLRGSEWYRKETLRVLVEEMLCNLIGESGGKDCV